MQEKVAELWFKNFILYYGIDVKGKTLNEGRDTNQRLLKYITRRRRSKLNLTVAIVGLERKS